MCEASVHRTPFVVLHSLLGSSDSGDFCPDRVRTALSSSFAPDTPEGVYSGGGICGAGRVSDVGDNNDIIVKGNVGR